MSLVTPGKNDLFISVGFPVAPPTFPWCAIDASTEVGWRPACDIQPTSIALSLSSGVLLSKMGLSNKTYNIAGNCKCECVCVCARVHSLDGVNTQRMLSRSVSKWHWMCSMPRYGGHTEQG